MTRMGKMPGADIYSSFQMEFFSNGVQKIAGFGTFFFFVVPEVSVNVTEELLVYFQQS